MKRVFVAGGATFDSIVHVNKFFGPVPGTIFSHGLHETTGGTGSGKAMNLARLGFDTRFHYFAGKDRYAREINKSLKKAGSARISHSTRPGPNGTSTSWKIPARAYRYTRPIPPSSRTCPAR